MQGARPVYLVLHIPKTAGSTLRETFELNFGRDGLRSLYHEVPPPSAKKLALSQQGRSEAVRAHWAHLGSPATRCLFGHHVTADLHEWLPEAVEPRYISFLRDPLARCVSLYHELKASPGARDGKAIRDHEWSLDEWVERGAASHVSNGQLKYLLRSATTLRLPREVTAQDLEEGKRRLRGFWYLGLTESFSEDSHYLYGALGFRRYSPRRVSNATRRRDVVSFEVLERLRERNAFDVELHAFAREQRQRFLHREGSRYRRTRRKAWAMRWVDVPRQLGVDVPRQLGGRLARRGA